MCDLSGKRSAQNVFRGEQYVLSQVLKGCPGGGMA